MEGGCSLGAFVSGLLLASLYGVSCLPLQELWLCVSLTLSLAAVASFSMGLSSGVRTSVCVMLPSLSAGQTSTHLMLPSLSAGQTSTHLMPEMAKVHTSFTQVEVQRLVFKNTLVKVEVLTKLLYSSRSTDT